MREVRYEVEAAAGVNWMVHLALHIVRCSLDPENFPHLVVPAGAITSYEVYKETTLLREKYSFYENFRQHFILHVSICCKCAYDLAPLSDNWHKHNDHPVIELHTLVCS